MAQHPEGLEKIQMCHFKDNMHGYHFFFTFEKCLVVALDEVEVKIIECSSSSS